MDQLRYTNNTEAGQSVKLGPPNRQTQACKNKLTNELPFHAI
jgi:hypothetical protein